MSEWSAWQPLAGGLTLSDAVLAETLDGGQAFRWHRQADGTWIGVWGECVAHVQREATGRITWRAPGPLAGRVAAALPVYLGLDRNFAALTDTLPWRSDPHVAHCLAAFPGLRILRQPFGETLLGFLCSATKQIVQIKQMIALLAERHGAPVAGHVGVNTIHRLPTWRELALIPEPDLRACQLGFRARYIAETAQWIAARPGWLEETEAAPYPLAKERLCLLPGVGEKVADCVLLFGAGRLEAFPVDTWILKALARRYGLADWRPAQVAHFGRAHFGPLAGLAQQFLFAYERAAARLDQSQAHGKK
ncbi:MAG: DNA glycosylase [Opitutaceae bacterium]|nr:DNA glycosylase [Opitutaceae bacterium]